MAYPASTKTLSTLLEAADGEATRMKQSAQQFRDASAVGPVKREKILQFVRWLDRAIAVWDEASSRGPGIAAYALEQKGVAVGSEFAAMRAAAVDLRNWVATLEAQSGAYSDLVDVSTTDTAQFRTLADAFIATVA